MKEPVLVFEKENFRVYHDEHTEYILHNASMDGFAHTHLHSMKQCKRLINLSLANKLPYDLSLYLLTSLSRINEGKYKEKVDKLIEVKKNKSKNYYINVTGGKRAKCAN